MKFNTLLIFMLLSFWGNAQNSSTIGVSYFGEMIGHPGLSFCYEKDFYSFQKVKMDKAQVQKKRTFFYGLEIGGFHHKNALNTGFSQIMVGFRKTGYKGRIWSASLGNGGFIGSIPNSFKIEDGVVSEVKSRHYYTMHSLNFSYGKKVSWFGGSQWFLSPTFYIKQPAFPKYTAHFALRMGLKKTL
ncbi:MAG: hypothetical protein ACPGLV_08960 [Bacteroidia bacterium]